MDDIVDFVKEQRSRRGVTQADLATMAGVSRHTVSDLESGKLRNIGAGKLDAILRALGFRLSVMPAQPAPLPHTEDGYMQAAARFKEKYASTLSLNS